MTTTFNFAKISFFKVLYHTELLFTVIYLLLFVRRWAQGKQHG